MTRRYSASRSPGSPLHRRGTSPTCPSWVTELDSHSRCRTVISPCLPPRTAAAVIGKPSTHIRSCSNRPRPLASPHSFHPARSHSQHALHPYHSAPPRPNPPSPVHRPAQAQTIPAPSAQSPLRQPSADRQSPPPHPARGASTPLHRYPPLAGVPPVHQSSRRGESAPIHSGRSSAWA